MVAGLFALSAKDAQKWYVLIAALPTLCFWGLDAYYLHQERLFRKLFERAASNSPDIPLYSMNVSLVEAEVSHPLRVAFSRTLLFFYGPVVIAIAAVAAIIWE